MSRNDDTSDDAYHTGAKIAELYEPLERAATALEALAEAALQTLPFVRVVALAYVRERELDETERDGVCVVRSPGKHEWVRRAIGWGAEGQLSVCLWCHAELRDDDENDGGEG